MLKVFGSDTNIQKKQDQDNTNTIEIQAEEIDERDK
jgi:hypothetical protein